MEYTIIINDRSYDLPKKTVAVMEKLDEALKVDSLNNLSVRQKYERLHGCVKSIVGDENAEEMFGSANLNEIDLSDVALAVLKINDAYNKPLSDYKTNSTIEKINSIPTEKISSMAKAAQSIVNAQGMKK